MGGKGGGGELERCGRDRSSDFIFWFNLLGGKGSFTRQTSLTVI